MKFNMTKLTSYVATTASAAKDKVAGAIKTVSAVSPTKLTAVVVAFTEEQVRAAAESASTCLIVHRRSSAAGFRSAAVSD
jgi:hypothetical protein